MTAHEMVYALNVFDTTQEIYFINKDIPPYPGVYFLYDYDGNLIYIGKSNNLKNRLYQSIREKKKEVSYFSFALTETDADAIIYEQYYMTKHGKPKFNTEYPSDGTSLKLPELYFTTMTAIRK
jgi:excinuclease UvrABC nuclease subunit